MSQSMFPAVLILVSFLMVLALSMYTTKYQKSFHEKCRDAAGIVIQSSGGIVCIKYSNLIEIK